MAIEWFPKTKKSSPAPRTQPSKNMVQLGQLLDESLILRLPDAVDKVKAIETLVGALAKARELPAESCLAKVLEREQGISTTLDTGLSLPHARIAGLKGFVAALGLFPQAIPEPLQPELSIKAMLVFFSPDASDDKTIFQKHLLFLKHVSTLFQPDLIGRLLAAPTSKEALALIREKEAQSAKP